MAIYDDSAILKTREGYARPSDLELNKPVELLTVDEEGNEKYRKCIIKETLASCSTIRFSHGVILNLGQDNVMIGKIKTGWEGCVPETTHDVVKDIRKNFKYQPHYIKDIEEEKEYFIDLEEVTDRKSGTINIFNKDYFKFFGLAARIGKYNAKDNYVLPISSFAVGEYADLIARLPLEVIKVENSFKKCSYICKKNWFTDLTVALCGTHLSYAIADDMLFHAPMELLKEFREGFVNCRALDIEPRHAENTRYGVNYKEETVSDLCFLLRRAGFNTLLIKRKPSGYRISESEPKWSQYIQEVRYIDVPKKVFEITPVSSSRSAALWVNEVLFQL